MGWDGHPFTGRGITVTNVYNKILINATNNEADQTHALCLLVTLRSQLELHSHLVCSYVGPKGLPLLL